MHLKQDCLALLGACIGGTLGYYAFHWLTEQGMYGLLLPGGLLGIGAGIFGSPSKYMPFIFGLLAIALGTYTEWSFLPFRADDSLSYFVMHVHELKPATQLMILGGGLIAAWMSFRGSQRSRRSHATHE